MREWARQSKNTEIIIQTMFCCNFGFREKKPYREREHCANKLIKEQRGFSDSDTEMRRS